MLLTAPAMAAERYAVGEDVEVFHLNQWKPGVVMESNKRGVHCSFVFAGGTHDDVFEYDKVRHLFESGALARARTWSDATGKYTVRAALMKISNGKVELRTR